MINPAAILKMKEALNTFNYTHPRVKPFISAVAAKGVPVDSVIEVSVTTPDGEKMTSNIKIRESDLELLEMIKSMNQ